MFKPLGMRVLVKEIKEEKEFGIEGFIVAPSVSEEKSSKFEVISLGKGDEPFEVNVGDTVFLNRFAGTDIAFMEGHKVVRTDDIMGIIEND